MASASSAVGGVLGRGEVQQFGVQRAGAWPGVLAPQVVQGTVPGYGRRPAPEARPVAAEPAEVAGDFEPGVGGDVLRVVADEAAHITEQQRLEEPVDHREGVLVPALGAQHRGPELHVAVGPPIVAPPLLTTPSPRVAGILHSADSH